MTFDQFLNPQRKPPVKFTMEGFGDAVFEMRVVSREEEREIRERYPDADNSDRLDAMIAYSLMAPAIRSKDFLDALKEREGRTILDPLEVLHTVFTSNECNTLFDKYSKLSNLTTNAAEKISDLKNE